MKRLALLATLCAASLLSALRADDVAPATLQSIALYRDATSIPYTTNTYYTQGASLLITNLQLFVDSAGAVTQGLLGITIEAAVASSSTATGSTWTAGAAISTNAGTCYVTIPALPESSTIYWQVRITDAATNRYYYEKQMLRATSHL